MHEREYLPLLKKENQFGKINDFQTSVRGLKVRGSYSTQEEAELRCRMLREVDPNHNIFVGPVGQWMPWNPDAYKTGKVEYLEEELNNLMNEKQKSEASAKQEFEKRVKESKRQAIEENIKIAKETGNKLTQGLTEEGELVGVKEMNTQERVFNNSEEVASSDIRKELFEGGNIRASQSEERKAMKEALAAQNANETKADDNKDDE